MKIYYGIKDNYTDVTEIVYNKCIKDNYISITGDDQKRNELFTDVIPNVRKHILIVGDKTLKYDLYEEIYIPLPDESSKEEAQTEPDIIILIIDANSDNYNRMRYIWRKYMNTNNKIKSYFIKAEEDERNFISLDTIYWKGKETFENIIFKTIYAMKKILSEYPNVKYIFRTNLSSFVDFELLLKYIDTAPRTKMYGGVIGHYNSHDKPEWSNKFVSGSGMLLSMDVVKCIIETFEKPDFKIDHPIDDVIIGKALEDKIKITHINRHDEFIESNIFSIANDKYTSKCIESAKKSGTYHYRCRHVEESFTVFIQAILYNKIYL